MWEISVATHMPPNGDPAHNPGLCPDWESNQWPFGSQAAIQSTEPHQPGLEVNFLRDQNISPCSYCNTYSQWKSDIICTPAFHRYLLPQWFRDAVQTSKPMHFCCICKQCFSFAFSIDYLEYFSFRISVCSPIEWIRGVNNSYWWANVLLFYGLIE